MMAITSIQEVLIYRSRLILFVDKLYLSFPTSKNLSADLQLKKSISLGAATSQVMTRFTSPAVNSLISLVVETSIFLTTFGILFHLDNKHRFLNEQTQMTESRKVKWVML
jgi:hypothetical protein